MLPGTPGSLLERKNAGGFMYYAHQYYDSNGKKLEKYLAGPVGDTAAEEKASQLREKIASINAILKNLRLLGREGFKVADNKTFAITGALCNHGLFDAGALLVGSQAYGALLNKLGARAAAYTTQDVDIARGAKLVFEVAPALGFIEMLRESGVPIVEVPRLDNREPSTSFKESGKSLFQVDLLVPSSTEDVGIVAVPELRAHATSLPYLRYLLGDSQEATLLAREGCCTIRIPTPERFALHKLIVSQIRKRTEKSVKDVSQAAVLIAILSERHPGAIEDAAKSIPASALDHVRRAYSVAREKLQSHPRAIDTMDSIFGIPGNREDVEVRR